MKKLKKLPPIGTIYGLCMLAIGLLYLGYLFFPLLSKTDVLDEIHAENEKQIAVYESYVQETPQMKTNIQSLEKECKAALQQYPLEGKKIINDIDKGFVSYGVEIDTISMSDEALVMPEQFSYDEKPLYSLPISITFSTMPKTLENLLTYFEQSGTYYINSVSAIEQKDKSINVNLTLSAYYFAPQKEVVKSAQKGETIEVAQPLESEKPVENENTVESEISP